MNKPLFPLNALVCPGGRLPLRIFEPRYLDMIRECLRNSSGFIIVMLKDGQAEVNTDASEVAATTFAPDAVRQPIYAVGTSVKIVDFDQGEDGILGVVVEGIERVNILRAHKQENGLWVGDVEVADPESIVTLPEEFTELKSVLQALVQHPVVQGLNIDIDYADCSQIGWRLTELLPLENAQKQYLYELEDPVYRLEKISDQLDVMIS